MMALVQTQLAEMRAEHNSALKTELEIMKLRMDQRQQYGQPAQIEQNGSQILGDALIAAFTKIMSQGRAVQDQPAPAALPQNVEESTHSTHAQYPSDAVITTTTTVDTTKPLHANKRAQTERSEFSDVDGFYDNIDF